MKSDSQLAQIAPDEEALAAAYGHGNLWMVHMESSG